MRTRVKALLLGFLPLAAWASPTVPTVSAVMEAPLAAATVAPNPLQVVSVSVVLSGTTGYAREAGLEQAARQALPQVLAGPKFGLARKAAEAKVRAIGDIMPMVARYNIVQEKVLPSYSLLVDLTFNEAKLRQNFGGAATPTPTAPTAAGRAAAVTEAGVTEANTAQTTAARSLWRIEIAEPTAAGQDRARVALNALPNTTATVHEATRAGVVLQVASSQLQSALEAALAGWNPYISALQSVPMVAAPAATPSYGAREAFGPEVPAVASPTAPATAPTMAPAGSKPAWFPDFW